MPPIPPEPPARRDLRDKLRSLTIHVEAGLQAHEIDLVPCEISNIRALPMVLDADSKFRPAFFSPLPADSLLDPDDEFDRMEDIHYDSYDSAPEAYKGPSDRVYSLELYFSEYTSYFYYRFGSKNIPWSEVSIDPPFVGLYRYKDPQFGVTSIHEMQDKAYPHMQAVAYNGMNGTDGQILRGELIIILRLMIGQLRRARYMEHMIAPVLLFSFLGPQHARLIEAHFDGECLILRPTKLYDLREKDVAAFKTFGRYFYAKPIWPKKS